MSKATTTPTMVRMEENEIITDSYIMSKQFGLKHGNVIRIIKRVGVSSDIIRTKIKTTNNVSVKGYLITAKGVDIINSARGTSKAKSTKLYIISMESTNYIKIGITNNVEKRLKTLQTANPLKLNIEFVSEFENVKKLESFLHHTFKKQRMTGEWFEISHTEIVRVIKGSSWN